MMGFVRPIGSKKINVFGGSGQLPWEVWKILSDNSAISRLWGDHINLPSEVGSTGLIVDVARDFQVTWPIEALEIIKGSLMKFGVIGNPWHHRPDIVDSTITLTIGDRIGLEMDGFDLSHIGDPSFLFASSWALSRLASLVKACGGNMESITGTRSVVASGIYQTEPDMIRSWILTPEKAVLWLGDQVDIEPRLGGRFAVRWNKPWGGSSLEGSIDRFDPGTVSVRLSDPMFGSGGEEKLVFSLSQNGQDTRLTITVTGFDIEPWANVPLMVMAETIQLQLASLSLELGNQFRGPA